ncbi:MAG TPA: hypothetical protein VED19_00755 [Candidatus Nitrosopolaris sp.]|nr:hypothetical protein [Candidatus Nitrosopolaris sp.]
MKIRSVIWGIAAAGCTLTLACPPQASAAVSDEDFNALKNLVTEQGQKIEQLEKTNALDRQQIQQLQQQLGQTQTVATNAAQKVETLSQIQPTYPLPNPTAGATHNFMIVGDAEVQFGKTAAQHSGFALADFAPIFLFRANDNVLFEAGFDTTLQNAGGPPGTGSGTSTTLSLSFAQLDYLLNDYVTVIAGEMLLPLGTYNERNAGWLNKIPDAPLLDDQILPGSGVGAQLRGAVPVGDDGQMLTYSVYGVNGPGSVNGSGSAFQTPGDPTSGPNLDLNSNVGILGDGTQQNLHGNPSGGGRIGWFYPWKLHHDIELGISGQSGEWDDAGNHLWSAAVLDAAVHLGQFFEVKGEYANTWYGTDDAGTVHPHGWWVQAGYKLAGLNLNFPLVNDVELVGRYDGLNDGLGTKTDRYAAGFVYYLNNTLWFEGEYEYLSSHGPAGLPPNDFVLQLSYGF